MNTSLNQWIAKSAGLVLGLALMGSLSACQDTSSQATSQASDVSGASAAETVSIQVYKTPTCGCCSKWIDHLRDEGFAVTATDLPDLTSLKQSNAVPPKLASCHTAIVDGYVLEGHVPAKDVRRLLEEKPRIAGLAVPGMPMGSPGMEHPDTRRHEAYDVVAFGVAPEAGAVEAYSSTRVFASHAPNES